MRLDEITPVVLTFNERPNIRRTLERLGWAKDIVVVDSGSDDGTLEIVREFPAARVFQHPFLGHAEQWRYAVGETGISTPWVLGLDADLIVSDDFLREVETLTPPADIAGYDVGFRYCVVGRPLPRSIFPPRILLFRRASVRFEQDGHAHRVAVSGRVGQLRHRVDHDDRKPLSRWLASQDGYARLESDKLATAQPQTLGRADRLRRHGFIAPVAMLFYCLFIKRLIFSGLPGWYYTYQRVLAEMLLSLYLIENRLVEREPR